MTDFQTAISSLAEQLYGDAPAPQQEAAQEPTEGVTEGAEPETQEGGAVQEETAPAEQPTKPEGKKTQFEREKARADAERERANQLQAELEKARMDLEFSAREKKNLEESIKLMSTKQSKKEVEESDFEPIDREAFDLTQKQINEVASKFDEFKYDVALEVGRQVQGEAIESANDIIAAHYAMSLLAENGVTPAQLNAAQREEVARAAYATVEQKRREMFTKGVNPVQWTIQMANQIKPVEKTTKTASINMQAVQDARHAAGAPTNSKAATTSGASGFSALMAQKQKELYGG